MGRSVGGLAARGERNVSRQPTGLGERSRTVVREGELARGGAGEARQDCCNGAGRGAAQAEVEGVVADSLAQRRHGVDSPCCGEGFRSGRAHVTRR
ncbi:MAG TPA: hypothetical protein PLS53_18110 [Thermoanaerobaculaceae bacterium]|nr:hypothetical protein [Thermoanaerobaculaceae bacterium]HPS80077.1 hypothetical protein [Thermoanaerobaculaceae bacterium]